MTDELADDVLKATGVPVKDYNITIRGDEINHILKKHSNIAGETLRGQIPVNDDNIALIASVFDDPDSIKISPDLDYAGRKAVEFEKRINGVAVTVNGISDGKKSLEVDTFYIHKSKRPPTTSNGVSALEPTSGTGSRPASSVNNIPQLGADGNVQNIKTQRVPEVRGAADYGPGTVGAAQSRFPYVEKTSKVAGNTYENTPLFTDAEKNLGALGADNPKMNYRVTTEKQSMQEAAERLAADYAGEAATLGA